MSLLTLFANAEVAFAALIGGALAIYAELARPGLVLPGVAGATLLLLALFALPLSLGGAALLLAAAALFVLEGYFSARGILGAAAGGALVWAAIEMRVNAAVAFALTAPFTWVTVRMVSLVFRAWRCKGSP